MPFEDSIAAVSCQVKEISMKLLFYPFSDPTASVKALTDDSSYRNLTTRKFNTIIQRENKFF